MVNSQDSRVFISGFWEGRREREDLLNELGILGKILTFWFAYLSFRSIKVVAIMLMAWKKVCYMIKLCPVMLDELTAYSVGPRV